MLTEAQGIKTAEQKQIIATHGLNYLREPIVVIFLCLGLYFILENKEDPTKKINWEHKFYNLKANRIDFILL